MSKTLVIGIDGAPYTKLKEWALPTLSKIGPLQRLESVIPAISCPSWPCMFTGQTPSQLGMYDFIDFGTGNLHNSNDWWVQSMFANLDKKGKKQVLLNIPISYPTHPLDGILVTGLGTPSRNSPYTYPPELKGTLRGYDPSPLINIASQNKEAYNLDTIISSLMQRFQLTANVLREEENWDLFFLVLYEIDPLMHYFWKYLNTSSRWNIIEKEFGVIDFAISEILERIPKDTKVFIVSDHGFGSFKKGFNINRWLEQEGYLTFKKEIKDSTLKDLVRGLPFSEQLSKLAPKKLVERFSTKDEVNDLVTGLRDAIDWEKTIAYAPGSVSGCILLKEPPPNKEIETKLSKVGFDTAYVDSMLTVLATDGKYPVNSWKKDIWNKSSWSGSHTLDGIFITNQERYQGRTDLKIPDIRQIIESEVLDA